MRVTDQRLDLLTDCLRRVKKIFLRNDGRATDADLLNIEREIRQEYAGCRVYVGARLATDERYRSIGRDVEAGMGFVTVAQRHDCSLKTVRRAVDTLGIKVARQACQSANSTNQPEPCK